MEPYEELLEFFYRTPVGLALVDDDGTVSMLNAAGVQLLMPYVGSLDLTNLFDVFDLFDPDLRSEIQAHVNVGPIIVERRVFQSGSDSSNCLTLNVERMSADRVHVTFQDATLRFAQETELVEMAEQLGVREGQTALTATIVHDLGNALVSTRTELTQLGADADISETDELQRLGSLLVSLESNLVEAIGEPKTQALQRFVDELVSSLTERQGRLRNSVQMMLASFDHAQEIISLNRTLALGSMAPQIALDGETILSDSLLLITPMARNAEVTIRTKRGKTAKIRGDRTRLTQLIVNLLKNAMEACADLSGERPEILIASEPIGQMWVLSVDDSGPGMSHDEMMTLNSGELSEQSGLGLRSTMAIVDAHNGELTFSPSKLGGLSVQVKIPHDGEADDH